MPTRVFVSYRHSDSRQFSERLYRSLTALFGVSNVFRDTETIPGGAAFDDYIRGALSATDIALVVIGPGWQQATDEAGRPRLEQFNDPVRTEVAAALALKRLVIPLLVDETPLPDATDLPAELAPLVHLQAYHIHTDERYETDVAAMRAQVDTYMKARRLANLIGLVSAVVLPLYTAISLTSSSLQHSSFSQELINLLLPFALLTIANAVYVGQRRQFSWLWLNLSTALVALGAGLFALTTPPPASVVYVPLIALAMLLAEIVWVRYTLAGPRYSVVKSLDHLRSSATEPPASGPARPQRGLRLGMLGTLLGLVAAVVVWPAASFSDPSAIPRFAIAVLLIAIAGVCVTIAFIHRLLALRRAVHALSEYSASDLLPGFGGYSRASEQATARQLQLLVGEVILALPPLAASLVIATVGSHYTASPRFAALMGIVVAGIGLGTWLHASYSAWVWGTSQPRG
jgi:TIR domain